MKLTNERREKSFFELETSFFVDFQTRHEKNANISRYLVLYNSKLACSRGKKGKKWKRDRYQGKITPPYEKGSK